MLRLDRDPHALTRHEGGAADADAWQLPTAADLASCCTGLTGPLPEMPPMLASKLQVLQLNNTGAESPGSLCPQAVQADVVYREHAHVECTLIYHEFKQVRLSPPR